MAARDGTRPIELRIDGAQRGAPYVHPRLSVTMLAIAMSGALIVEIVKFARHDELGEKQLGHVPRLGAAEPA